MRLSALVISICLSTLATSIPAHATDVFSADLFAANDPNKDFDIEIMSYNELMAQTPAARTAYLKGLQAMYLHALQIEAKNPRLPGSIGSNSKIPEMLALLESFSSEANAMGGGGRARSGAEVSAQIDADRAAAQAVADEKKAADQAASETQLAQAQAQLEAQRAADRKTADGQVASTQTEYDTAQKAVEQCQAKPKPANCNSVTMRNRQANLETARAAHDAAVATQKRIVDEAAERNKPVPAPYVSPNADVDMSPEAVAKNLEIARAAHDKYVAVKRDYDNCMVHPTPKECNPETIALLKDSLANASKAYEAAVKKMPSDPRSEPGEALARPGAPSALQMVENHKQNVSCRKDSKPLTCVAPEKDTPAAKSRQKKIEAYERKFKSTNRCTTGFLDSNSSGSCQNVSQLKVGTLDLSCKSKSTTMCNPWMYGAGLEGSTLSAICGDVPAKGSTKEKAVAIAISCTDKSAKTKNATENFLNNSKVLGVKEGWDEKLRQPLSRLCGGPLRMEANCEICQKLAADARLSISRSGVIRKCDIDKASPPAAGGGSSSSPITR